MAGFIIKANNNHSWYRLGAFCDVREDGAFWAKKETLPNFIRIELQGMAAADGKYLIKGCLYTDYEVRTSILEPDSIEIKEASLLPSIELAEAREKAFDFARDVLKASNIQALSANSIKFDKGDLTVEDIEIELIDKLREQLCLRYTFDHAIIADMVKDEIVEKEMTRIDFLAAIQDVTVV